MAVRGRAYRLSPLAETDLEDIWSFTAEAWSLNQAEIYHRDIIAVLADLASGQRNGRPVDIRDGYFKYSIGSHFVFYKLSDTAVNVIRILHQRMDASRYL